MVAPGSHGDTWGPAGGVHCRLGGILSPPAWTESSGSEGGEFMGAAPAGESWDTHNCWRGGAWGSDVRFCGCHKGLDILTMMHPLSPFQGFLLLLLQEAHPDTHNRGLSSLVMAPEPIRNSAHASAQVALSYSSLFVFPTRSQGLRGPWLPCTSQGSRGAWHRVGGWGNEGGIHWTQDSPHGAGMWCLTTRGRQGTVGRPPAPDTKPGGRSPVVWPGCLGQGPACPGPPGGGAGALHQIPGAARPESSGLGAFARGSR